MIPIKYDFTSGPMTIQWVPRNVLVGKIRCHLDSAVMPGPTRYSALVEVEPSGEYELTMLKKDKEEYKGPTFAEHSAVREYLESLGFHGLWRRAKHGAVKVVANVRGMSPKTNCGEMKMPEDKVQEGRLLVGVSLTAHNADGTVFAVHGHKFNMTEAQFAWLQDSLDGGTIADLKKIRDERLAAQAKAAEQAAA